MPTIGDHLMWLGSLLARQPVGGWLFGSPIDLKARIAPLDPHLLDVIDCGCGLSASLVSRQVLRLPFRRLVSVDGFPEIAALAAKLPSAAVVREIVCLPLAELAARYRLQKSFDVALCLDVLEHLAKPQAFQFLTDLEAIVRRRIVLWLPLGEYRVDADPHGRGNDFELHRSFWSADELAALGYATEVLPRFHHARYDALWAIKDLDGQ